MIQDPQEYLQQWEKENNPFYPDEMRWDRVKVNTFLKDWKQQCNIANVVWRSEQLPCDCNVKLAETTLQVYCPKCYKTHKMKQQGNCLQREK